MVSPADLARCGYALRESDSSLEAFVVSSAERNNGQRSLAHADIWHELRECMAAARVQYVLHHQLHHRVCNPMRWLGMHESTTESDNLVFSQDLSDRVWPAR